MSTTTRWFILDNCCFGWASKAVIYSVVDLYIFFRLWSVLVVIFHPQLKLVNKFGNLNSIKLTVWVLVTDSSLSVKLCVSLVSLWLIVNKGSFRGLSLCQYAWHFVREHSTSWNSNVKVWVCYGLTLILPVWRHLKREELKDYKLLSLNMWSEPVWERAEALQITIRTCVSMTTVLTFCSQSILQKSWTVSSRGPWVAMKAFLRERCWL